MTGETENNKNYKKATFGMGCFWAGDSLFGATQGVISTCVGYSGGTKESPKYRNLGDHTEVVDIVYDPEIISYSQLLNIFWNNHEYGLTASIKRQYMSLILCHDEEQRILAEKSRAKKQHELNENLVTEIKLFTKFYPAEDYHQKYRLQKHPKILENIGVKNSELLQTSPVAAKLNGYIAGVVSVDDYDKIAPTLGINENVINDVRKYVLERQGNGLYC